MALKAYGGAVATGYLGNKPHMHRWLLHYFLHTIWFFCVQALTSIIRKSTARTMMGLEKELKDAAASLQR